MNPLSPVIPSGAVPDRDPRRAGPPSPEGSTPLRRAGHPQAEPGAVTEGEENFTVPAGRGGAGGRGKRSNKAPAVPGGRGQRHYTGGRT